MRDTPTGDRLRAQLVGLFAVLVLLWGYAAYLTAGDAVELVRVRALNSEIGQPTDALILHLQAERRLTMLELAEPGQHNAALDSQHARTDEVVARLSQFPEATNLRLPGAAEVRQRADELVRRLSALGPLRAAVSSGGLDRQRAATAYTEMIDAGFGVYGAQWTSRESELIERTRAFVALARARELLAREDALVSGLLATGRISPTERSALAELVAAQRFVRAEAAAALPEPERGRYRQLSDGDGLRSLRTLEDRLVADARPGGTAADPTGSVDLRVWRTAVDPALTGLRELVTGGVRDSVTRATPSAVAVVVRVGLVGGLGLVAVVAALLGVVRAGRRSGRHFDRLREMAQNLADDGLPDAARRLRRGEAVETGDGWPAPAYGADPAAQVGQAIDAVRRSAVRMLAEQAEAERQNRDLFLHLTRRNQILLRRQLNLLDAMQRRETDAEELSDLFRVDHLATRVRRNVEKLITAAGGVPARRWRRPVPLVDVVRAAVAEVEDYPRVLVAPEWHGSLAGPAVNDLVHLLAELVENALAYSPPTAAVRLRGEAYGGDRTIEVRDAGPGMDPEALTVTNALLRDPPPVRPPEIGRGLYLVARTALRWGLAVELSPSPRCGITATVRVPATLVVDTISGTEEVPTAELPRMSPAGATVSTARRSTTTGDEKRTGAGPPRVVPAAGRWGGTVENPGGDPP